MWLGDYPANFTTVTVMFTTHAADGSPVAPNSAFEAADVRLYKDGSGTERTSQAGWTMTSPFDSLTGVHCLIFDLSDNTHSGFYASGHVYTVVLAPDETVAGLAVAKVLGQFGIDLYGALRPTTAGRTLDVSAGGEAGVDWANVGSPTTTVGLSGTTVKTATDVESDTADIQTRLPAALSGGNMKTDVLAISTSTTAADNLELAGLAYSTTRGLSGTALPAAAADAAGGLVISDAGGLDADAQRADVAAILVDTAEIGAAGAGLTAINLPNQTMDIVGNITGNLSGSVGSVTGAVGSVAANGLSASSLATDAAQEIADAILDRDMGAGTDSGDDDDFRTPREALRALRNRTAIAAGTLTVYKEDDSTPSWTAAVTTSSGNPISEIDPAGP